MLEARNWWLSLDSTRISLTPTLMKPAVEIAILVVDGQEIPTIQSRPLNILTDKRL